MESFGLTLIEAIATESWKAVALCFSGNHNLSRIIKMRARDKGRKSGHTNVISAHRTILSTFCQIDPIMSVVSIDIRNHINYTFAIAPET